VPEATAPAFVLADLDFTLTVDGKPYRVEAKRISARIAGEVEVGYLRDVEGLLSAVLTRKLSLVEVAALQFVAERLRGETPEPGANSDDITFGAKVELTLPESISASLGLDADPEA
jgi:hypothetical protein